jgi:phospholipase C
MIKLRAYRPGPFTLPLALAGALLTLLVAGCAGTNFTGSTAAPTVTLSASPASIAAGSSSVLTVTTTKTTQVTITGTDGTSYSMGPTGGTQKVSPMATATYTAVAAGIGGSSSAVATVTVSANSAPTITITAAPSSIAAGAAALLTVAAANATGVTISGSDGTSYTLGATGGTQSVSPSTTTTYTATATGAGATATANTTVTVTASAPPSVSIAANPTSIVAGASSILTVTALNATQVKITGSDGSSYTLTPSGGTQAIMPAQTTTYTATATGAGGSTTAQAIVTVSANPAPTVTLTAVPPSIAPGSSSTLTVAAANATTVTISGTDGSTYAFLATGGTQTVAPAATTTYTATATGPGGATTATAIVTVTANPSPTVTIAANPTTIVTGNSSLLSVTATNATSVTVTAPGGISYTLSPTGGAQSVSPTSTTTYTATATGTGGTATAEVTVTVSATGSVQNVDHVILMLQENHTFDNYFGMLNPYRRTMGMNVGADGVTYNVDGIDDKPTISNSDTQGTAYSLFKFTSTCIDDETSDWLASYGDANPYDFLATRPILMSGFVLNAEGYADTCTPTTCSGDFTDTTGQRAMGYYDQDTLNYYYYMASQFAVSDRWFSPVSSKSIDNRIATFTGGTTQGLVKDPGGDDHLSQLPIPTIFGELNTAGVSWKIYYTVTQGFCLDEDDCPATGSNAEYPATDFSSLQQSFQYIYENPTGAACSPPTQASGAAVGDPTNSFCIDVTHIAPISQLYTDLTNGTLPSFAFIEAGYGNNDEHPGSAQSILLGQAEVAKVVSAFTASPEWADSIFFLSYDEGGGPYDHVPPVPEHSNDFTNSTDLGATPPDISAIAVNADTYNPCPYTPSDPDHCDLSTGEPGYSSGDAPAEQGFAAQLGFRLPNIIISPFTRAHYVSHTPMDHTAVIKFVENRFIGPSAHLTARDAAQPDLLEFFDFNGVPWSTPPTPPTPTAVGNSCTPATFAPAETRKR